MKSSSGCQSVPIGPDRPSGIYVIGLTGGIASGKTTVSDYLKSLGVCVIDADEVAHEVTSPGSAGFEEVIEEFGEDLLTPEGNLNRRKLGEIVFSDKEALSKLNAIVHPLVIEKIRQMLTEIEGSHHVSGKGQEEHDVPCVVLDVPLLFESGMDDLCDEVWVVAVDEDTQVKRLMERDGYTFDEAVRRIKAQMPLEEKVRRAHRVLDNTGTIEETKRQVDELFEDVMRKLRNREEIT